jgi:hypothetical protein
MLKDRVLVLIALAFLSLSTVMAIIAKEPLVMVAYFLASSIWSSTILLMAYIGILPINQKENNGSN